MNEDARWAVTVAAQRLVLGPERRGELVFSVTNSGGFDDSVAVLVEPEGEAEASWFTVDDPQREVARGATVTFPVRVEVPAQVAPGEYAVRLRCYSADSAPEEDPALSPVVVVVVPSPPEKPKRRPWWLLLVAAALVVVLLVVLVVVLVSRGGDDSPGDGLAVMPDLVGLTEREALAELERVGLTARPSRYRHDPDNADRVVEQSFPAGSVVPAQSVVDLQVGVELVMPRITAPDGVPIVAAGEPLPALQWSPGPAYQRRWLVTFELERCVSYVDVSLAFLEGYEDCSFVAAQRQSVEVPVYTPTLTLTPITSYTTANLRTSNDFDSGWVRWRVAAVDDFGNTGPASEYRYFRMG